MNKVILNIVERSNFLPPSILLILYLYNLYRKELVSFIYRIISST